MASQFMAEDIGYQILLKKKKCLATKKMQKYIIFVILL
jgi:hypothetical protein